MVISFAPAAIIFVNDDLTDNVKSAIIRQLFIDDVMDGYEFDNRVLSNPEYPNIIHGEGRRILVIRSFTSLNNRDLADLVIFVKAGLASVESNKFGPPGKTLPVDRMYFSELITNPPFTTFNIKKKPFWCY